MVCPAFAGLRNKQHKTETNRMKKFIAIMALAAFACCVNAAPGSIEDKPKTCEKCKDCKSDCKCACHKKADDTKK